MFRVEDSPAASHLVVFEDRAEMDCVIKYLLDEFPDQTDTRWAEDVKAPVTVLLCYCEPQLCYRPPVPRGVPRCVPVEAGGRSRGGHTHLHQLGLHCPRVRPQVDTYS